MFLRLKYLSTCSSFILLKNNIGNKLKNIKKIILIIGTKLILLIVFKKTLSKEGFICENEPD